MRERDLSEEVKPGATLDTDVTDVPDLEVEEADGQEEGIHVSTE